VEVVPVVPVRLGRQDDREIAARAGRHGAEEPPRPSPVPVAGDADPAPVGEFEPGEVERAAARVLAHPEEAARARAAVPGAEMAHSQDGLAEMAHGLGLHDLAGESGEGGREPAVDERGPLEHGAAGGLDAERVRDAAAPAAARRGGLRPPDLVRRERRVAGGAGGIARRRHRRAVGGAAGEHEER